MFKIGDNIGGKYRILAELKRGNFGHVYRVHNFGMNRETVIKLVPSKDPSVLREIIESYAQGICQHANIVKIFACEVIDYQNPDGSMGRGILMELEWIAGGSWGQAIQSRYLSVAESCGIASDMLFGLHFAHQHAVIHGDVKPDNVFLDGESAKLADFGLSKMAALSGINRASDLFYVPHKSPELSITGEIDAQSDVFAAGLTLFRSVNNLSDWDMRLAALRDFAQCVATGTLHSRLGYNPDIPRKIRAIINKACNADPATRYRNCAEFRQAISMVRFKNAWVRVGPSAFSSTMGQKHETIEIKSVKARFDVEHKANGRKVTRNCASFGSDLEATKHLQRLLYDNTVE